MRERRSLARLAAQTMLAVILTLGCDDPEEDGLFVGTYNAGLAPGFVPLTEERAPHTVAAIAREPLDILCVQEVWRDEDARALEAATLERYPHRIVPAPQPAAITGPACTSEALAPLQACVVEDCADVPTGAVASCAIARCDEELSTLPAECASCLAAQIGASLPTIIATCTSESSESLAFGGSFGLGLFSRSPILEQELRVLEASFNRRGIVYARVDTPEVGEVHVFCTHLTPIFEDIPFPGVGSWEDEQRAQVETLLAMVAEKTGGEGRALLLGDLNTGPQLLNVDPVALDNYTALLGAFRDPYAENIDALCTFCPENPLVPAGSRPVLIDHVMVRGLEGPASRFLTEPLEVEVDGERVSTAYSDHFGLRASLLDD